MFVPNIGFVDVFFVKDFRVFIFHIKIDIYITSHI